MLVPGYSKNGPGEVTRARAVLVECGAALWLPTLPLVSRAGPVSQANPGKGALVLSRTLIAWFPGLGLQSFTCVSVWPRSPCPCVRTELGQRLCHLLPECWRRLARDHRAVRAQRPAGRQGAQTRERERGAHATWHYTIRVRWCREARRYSKYLVVFDYFKRASDFLGERAPFMFWVQRTAAAFPERPHRHSRMRTDSVAPPAWPSQY